LNSHPRGDLNLRKREKQIPALWATPIHKLSVNISIGQLGCLSGDAPPQLLHTSSLAEYGRLEKGLDFIATTGNISVVNTLLIVNPKHSSC